MDKQTEKSWFRQTEAKLYAYPALIAKHRQKLTEYLTLKPYPKARSYTAASFIRGGAVEGEAERWVLSREKIAQGILFLESKVQTEAYNIAALWEILANKEKQLVNLKYFEQLSMAKIAEKMNYSSQSCYVIRQRAVTKAAYIYSFLTYDEYLSILSEKR
jgi:predicted DNA-binding protein YlxM (UPF0122 family)